jgi:hypothetical protein
METINKLSSDLEGYLARALSTAIFVVDGAFSYQCFNLREDRIQRNYAIVQIIFFSSSNAVVRLRSRALWFCLSLSVSLSPLCLTSTQDLRTKTFLIEFE